MSRMLATVCGVLVLCSFDAMGQDPRLHPPTPLTPEDVKVPVDEQTLERQYRALAAMPSVEVRYSALGLVDRISGNTGISLPRRVRDLEPGDSAVELLKALEEVLLATGSETLIVEANVSSGSDSRTLRAAQTIRGIPVLLGLVAAGFEESTGLIDGVKASFLPDRGLPREAKLTADEAIQKATEVLESSGRAYRGSVDVSRPPTLAYYGAYRDATRAALVWVVSTSFRTPEEFDPDNEEMWIDAIDGTYLGGYDPSQEASCSNRRRCSTQVSG